jgi:TRAP-type mannitol/chloroaromatic compound transport system permease small subunit
MVYIIKPWEGIMGALLKLSRLIDILTEGIGKLSNWLVLLVILIGFYNVLGRYIGRFIGVKLASNSFIELQWYIFSLIFFLGFSYILKHDVNVRVDFLYAKWNEKRKALVDFLGTLLFLIPFCIIGIYVTLNPVLKSWGLKPNGTWGKWELSPDPGGLPRAPIKTMIIIAFAFLLLQAMSQAIKYFAILKGNKEIAKALEAETERLE